MSSPRSAARKAVEEALARLEGIAARYRTTEDADLDDGLAYQSQEASREVFAHLPALLAEMDAMEGALREIALENCYHTDDVCPLDDTAPCASCIARRALTGETE